MAEAVAAFYAVETAVEGAALGAFAVSRPTNPLHVHYIQKLKSPSDSLGRIHHSLNIIKGKAYVFGGDVEKDGNGNDNNIITLILGKDRDTAAILDYQSIEPEAKKSRPLEGVGLAGENEIQSEVQKGLPEARAGHASATIDNVIYIVGGRAPFTATTSKDSSRDETPKLYENDVVYGFDTLTSTWSTVSADLATCLDGIPCPRIGASCTSSPHPQPGTRPQATVEAHGTIFLHGGHNGQGTTYPDTWLFDISLRKWTRGPDLPPIGPNEVAGEGKIQYMNSRLWRAGDGFGQMMYLDLAENDMEDEQTRNNSILGVSLKTLTWQVLKFGGQAADQTSKETISNPASLPTVRQSYGLLPITTGAGRQYLLYFLGADSSGNLLSSSDFWSFQIQSDSKTPALVKDKVRKTVGKASGENEWAKCEVVQDTKESGPVDMPQDGLSSFAMDIWPDDGNVMKVVLWGGKNGTGHICNEGWVLTVQ